MQISMVEVEWQPSNAILEKKINIRSDIGWSLCQYIIMLQDKETEFLTILTNMVSSTMLQFSKEVFTEGWANTDFSRSLNAQSWEYQATRVLYETTKMD